MKGYAYGVRDPEHPGRTLRYGEGKLTGERALVVVTTGSPEAALGQSGINGQLDQVLFRSTVLNCAPVPVCVDYWWKYAEPMPTFA